MVDRAGQREEALQLRARDLREAQAAVALLVGPGGRQSGEAQAIPVEAPELRHAEGGDSVAARSGGHTILGRWASS